MSPPAPDLAPAARDRALPWLRLALAFEASPARAAALLREFQTPEAIFAAQARELKSVPGLGEKGARAVLDSALEKAAELAWERAGEAGVSIVTLADEIYPANARMLPSPPPVIYAKGALRPEDRLAVAVVGPRKPSDYARMMARSLVPPVCARGITIVSGMAYGIDAEAHDAAVQCGGRTIAVLGQGLCTKIYPSSNRALAERLVRDGLGALVSVFPLEAEPEPWRFPHRNEIIAALSLGVLVVEAAEDSGALITATHANEFGRTVMACPGDATRPSARGSNRLLAEGAALIQTSDDLLETMAAEFRAARDGAAPAEKPVAQADMFEPAPEKPRKRAAAGRTNADDAPAPHKPAAPRSADPLENRVFDLLALEHRSIDFILAGCAEAGFNQSAVVQKLLMMELAGRVTQLPGRIYALVPSV